jgi:hypothetical protein
MAWVVKPLSPDFRVAFPKIVPAQPLPETKINILQVCCTFRPQTQNRTYDFGSQLRRKAWTAVKHRHVNIGKLLFQLLNLLDTKWAQGQVKISGNPVFLVKAGRARPDQIDTSHMILCPLIGFEIMA